MRNKEMSLYDQLKAHVGTVGEKIQWHGPATGPYAGLLITTTILAVYDRTCMEFSYDVEHDTPAITENSITVKNSNYIWSRLRLTTFREPTGAWHWYVHILRSGQCTRCGEYNAFWIGNIRTLDQWELEKSGGHPYGYTQQYTRDRTKYLEDANGQPGGPDGYAISIEHAVGNLVKDWMAADSPLQMV